MLSRLRKAVPDIHSRYSLPATSSVRPAKLTSWPILDSSSLPKTYHHYSLLYRLLFNRPIGSALATDALFSSLPASLRYVVLLAPAIDQRSPTRIASYGHKLAERITV